MQVCSTLGEWCRRRDSKIFLIQENRLPLLDVYQYMFYICWLLIFEITWLTTLIEEFEIEYIVIAEFLESIRLVNH